MGIYPRYAAWDLAFHTLPLSIVDPDFAKQQMELMLRGVYLHPNGQMPAYEWNFSDVNPPVHAFATMFLHRTEQALGSETDVNFLRATFKKLLLNFTWWVNRKDRFGKNVFEGGFLGLDNGAPFPRRRTLLGSYTWAKLISNADTLTSFLETSGSTAAFQDLTNLAAEKSLVSFNVAHRAVISYVLDLPIGKGKKLLGNASGAAEQSGRLAGA